MERPILFINACVRKESRTMRLAEKLLSRLNQPYKEVILHEFPFPVTDEEFLNIRNQLISDRDFSNPMFELARQFVEAETIVIAAPYWDLSFPATLKQYFEYINVLGITFEYTDDGYPIGLCKADKIYYVTTAGGQFIPEEFGFGYVKALAENFYGIPDVREVEATGLDIEGADADSIMRAAEASIDEMNLE